MGSRLLHFILALVLASIPFAGAIADTVEQASEPFVGSPYLLGALGEGPTGKYDRDPIFRFDAFDCTTFVETVMARALSNDDSSFEKQMIAIRYHRGQVDFTTRNHFPEADWVPNNIAAGFIRDITAEVAGTEPVEIATVTIKKHGWYKKLGPKAIQIPGLSEEEHGALLSELHQEGEAFADAEATTPYLPLRTLFKDVETTQKILARIPSGAILNIVRPNWNLEALIGTNLNISHQVLAIRKNGTLIMRHASQVANRVVDVSLEDELRSYLTSKTIRGIQILEIQSNASLP